MPIAMLERYLAAAAARRLDEAASFLAPGARLEFPQGTFHDLSSLAEAMASRYRRIDKSYQTWDVCDQGLQVVVATGTLSGVNVHGVPFEGIRFCDRFVVHDGKIVLQQVWNDLAESGVLDRGS